MLLITRHYNACPTLSHSVSLFQSISLPLGSGTQDLFYFLHFIFILISCPFYDIYAVLGANMVHHFYMIFPPDFSELRLAFILFYFLTARA